MSKTKATSVLKQASTDWQTRAPITAANYLNLIRAQNRVYGDRGERITGFVANPPFEIDNDGNYHSESLSDSIDFDSWKPMLVTHRPDNANLLRLTVAVHAGDCRLKMEVTESDSTLVDTVEMDVTGGYSQANFDFDVFGGSNGLIEAAQQILLLDFEVRGFGGRDLYLYQVEVFGKYLNTTEI